ncbi:MAG: 30S ribosomal protein S9 [Verrucomicrobiota bacterium]|jgi:small subunit ribosomal protein S9|nr:30S ribosomal protein S9 [Verrucomicrobiota bacterium]MDI9384439.1 30S ribosomal protein S9 [Verrucomicrobiota bacterium]HCF93611.1 30S ribosomal protein S9 [Verrucomicrobiota bacterium]
MAAEATQEFIATGRRKTAVARVRIRPGTGRFLINGRSLENFFPVETLRQLIVGPLEVTEQTGKWDIRAKMDGGGISGQAGALRHGIARALIEADAEMRPVLKSNGFLTRDPRMKERKKYGRPGARKRFQFSKR